MNIDQAFLLFSTVIALCAATGLLVFGTADWAAERLSEKRELYEDIVGEELHRLFLDISPGEYLLINAALIVVLAVLGFVLGGFILAGAGLVIGIFGPRFYLKYEWNQRIDKINEQVEEAMVYMANSFKANPSLPEAIEDVTRSMPPPISEEFRVLVREYRLGTPLDEALLNLQDRVPAKNLELAISALLIGRTVGGDIPQILEDIADTIREAYRLERFIDKTTKQGRMQAWVMGLAPVGVAFFLNWAYPEYAGVLFDTLLGNGVLVIAAVLDAIGVYLVMKIMDIRV